MSNPVSNFVSKNPSDVLTAWLKAGYFTARELANVACVDRETFYKWKSGERDVPMDAAISLSHYAEREKGLTDLADCLHTPEFHSLRRGASEANGRIEEEVSDLTEATGDLRKAHRRKDRAAMDAAIADAERALENARAERDRI